MQCFELILQLELRRYWAKVSPKLGDDSFLLLRNIVDLIQQQSLVHALLLLLIPLIGSAYSQDPSVTPPSLKPAVPERPPLEKVSQSAKTLDSKASLFEELSLDSLGTDSGASEAGSKLSTNGLSGISELGASGVSASSWKDNLRFTVDVANRSLFLTETGDYANLAFFGIDVHKVFTADDGDIGTLILQPFLIRTDNLQVFPGSLFDDPHDWVIDWRISNFNFNPFGRGKPKIRIGSFELPFGLEQNVNTNGTIREYAHFQNFGIKTDWGVTLNGVANDVEYEVAVTRGSGNRFRKRGDPFLLVGRVGTARDQPVILGVSGLHGETVNFDGDSGTTRRSRLGADLTFGGQHIVYMAEATAGFEDEARVFSGLIEFDKFNDDESLLLYNQFFIRGLGETDAWDYEVRNSIGARWQVDSHWALSTQISHFFDSIGNGGDGTDVAIQARYRF